MSHSTQNR